MNQSAAANKSLILRFYEEVWNCGNVNFAHEVFAEDYIRHDLRIWCFSCAAWTP